MFGRFGGGLYSRFALRGYAALAHSSFFANHEEVYQCEGREQPIGILCHAPVAYA